MDRWTVTIRSTVQYHRRRLAWRHSLLLLLLSTRANQKKAVFCLCVCDSLLQGLSSPFFLFLHLCRFCSNLEEVVCCFCSKSDHTETRRTRKEGRRKKKQMTTIDERISVCVCVCAQYNSSVVHVCVITLHQRENKRHQQNVLCVRFPLVTQKKTSWRLLALSIQNEWTNERIVVVVVACFGNNKRTICLMCQCVCVLVLWLFCCDGSSLYSFVLSEQRKDQLKTFSCCCCQLTDGRGREHLNRHCFAICKKSII